MCWTFPGTCLRGINTCSEVCANIGMSQSRALLKYCSMQRSRTKVDHLPTWCGLPEVCAASACGCRISFLPTAALPNSKKIFE
jgi:hypothetical protein